MGLLSKSLTVNYSSNAMGLLSKSRALQTLWYALYTNKQLDDDYGFGIDGMMLGSTTHFKYGSKARE